MKRRQRVPEKRFARNAGKEGTPEAEQFTLVGQQGKILSEAFAEAVGRCWGMVSIGRARVI